LLGDLLLQDEPAPRVTEPAAGHSRKASIDAKERDAHMLESHGNAAAAPILLPPGLPPPPAPFAMNLALGDAPAGPDAQTGDPNSLATDSPAAVQSVFGRAPRLAAQAGAAPNSAVRLQRIAVPSALIGPRTAGGSNPSEATAGPAPPQMAFALRLRLDTTAASAPVPSRAPNDSAPKTELPPDVQTLASQPVIGPEAGIEDMAAPDAPGTVGNRSARQSSPSNSPGGEPVMPAEPATPALPSRGDLSVMAPAGQRAQSGRDGGGSDSSGTGQPIARKQESDSHGDDAAAQGVKGPDPAQPQALSAAPRNSVAPTSQPAPQNTAPPARDGKPAEAPRATTTAQPEAPAGPQDTSKTQQPLNEISIHLPGGGSKVDVRILDRGGNVQIAVRTPDDHLSDSLRQNIGDLVTRLEHKGYETEAWVPHTGAPAIESAGHVAADSNRGQSFQGRQSDSSAGQNRGGQDQSGQGGRRRNPRPQWLEEFEQSFRQTTASPRGEI
jgi:hypothetical protein